MGNPHQSERKGARVFNANCAACHTGKNPSGGDCPYLNRMMGKDSLFFGNLENSSKYIKVRIKLESSSGGGRSRREEAYRGAASRIY